MDKDAVCQGCGFQGLETKQYCLREILVKENKPAYPGNYFPFQAQTADGWCAEVNPYH